MRTSRPIVAVLAALALIPSVATPQQAAADVDVYTTPGPHTVNGREWRTTCEPYSQTQRCRTEIKATVVSYEGGRFVPKTDWAFNNLTYAPSPRTLWKSNPLGGNGVVGGKNEWTAADGRKWRTECDSAATGRGGCRSYIEASVVESYRTATGATSYRWVTTWLMNNMVRFTSTPAKPAPTPLTTDGIVDIPLRQCVNREAKAVGSLAKVAELDCSYLKIKSLAGFPNLPNLTILDVSGNELKTIDLPKLEELHELYAFENALAGPFDLNSVPPSVDLLALSYNRITKLTGSARNLTSVHLSGNPISDVAALAGSPRLEYLYVSETRVTNLTSLKAFPNLLEIDLSGNGLTDVTPLGSMTGLESLILLGNKITSVEGLAPLTGLIYLDLGYNRIKSVEGLTGLTNLGYLALLGNPLEDVELLRPLWDQGTYIDVLDPELDPELDETIDD